MYGITHYGRIANRRIYIINSDLNFKKSYLSHSLSECAETITNVSLIFLHSSNQFSLNVSFSILMKKVFKTNLKF